MRVGRFVGSMRVWFVVAMCALFALMPLGQASAYQGETEMWTIEHRTKVAGIVVARLDTGDVNSNTDFVNMLDGQMIREILSSDYKNVKFVGYEDPVPGTTVVRRFTFTFETMDGVMLITDEWGPNIWMFTFVGSTPSEAAMNSFVSATVQNRLPSEIPTGYGPAKLSDN